MAYKCVTKLSSLCAVVGGVFNASIYLLIKVFFTFKATNFVQVPILSGIANVGGALSNLLWSRLDIEY